jgi:hypothetical protein
MQSSYLQTNKSKKKRFDDAGYEETPVRSDKKKKKDFSQDRQRKRGDQ